MTLKSQCGSLQAEPPSVLPEKLLVCSEDSEYELLQRKRSVAKARDNSSLRMFSINSEHVGWKEKKNVSLVALTGGLTGFFYDSL